MPTARPATRPPPATLRCHRRRQLGDLRGAERRCQDLRHVLDRRRRVRGATRSTTATPPFRRSTPGGTLHELVTVATADGTTRQIDITINGANDAAVITGTATGSVTEKSGVAQRHGRRCDRLRRLSTATDVDSSATFVVQSGVAKTYGTFSIDAAGAWSYTLDDDNADVQALKRRRHAARAGDGGDGRRHRRRRSTSRSTAPTTRR